MKRIGAFMMALWLLMSVGSVGVAAGNPTVALSEAEGNPGQTVSVTIRLEDNPGLISAKVCIGYDSTALELVGYDLGGFPASGYSTGKLTNQPFVVNFCDGVAAGNYTFEEFATLHFRIREDAPAGTYPLTISCDFEGDFFNRDWDTVYFGIDEGSITVLRPGDTTSAKPTTSANTADTTATTGDGTAAPTSTATTAVSTAPIGTQSTQNPSTTPSAQSAGTDNTPSDWGWVWVTLLIVAVFAASVVVVLLIRKKK
jgi:hypothetical protein